MQLRIAVLADFASYTIDRKLNILGVFSNIGSVSEPVTQALMFMVFQIDFDSTEIGQKDVKIVLHDDDGHELVRMGGPVTIGRPQPGQAATFSQVVQFTNVVFPHFGTYEFSVLINDRVEGQAPLTVTKIVPPAVPAN